MSFAESVKSFKTFNEFLNYILQLDNYRDSNTINIYHIHIGSKTHMRIVDTNTNAYTHNHEYTLFIKTLFNNPLKQFSPEFISQLSEYPEIKLRNVVILIDPMYIHSPELEGFNELSSMTYPFTNETVVQHCNDTITTISTSIEILQLPFDITEPDILKLIEILNYISHLHSVLIHIMDCTSQVMLNLYANTMSMNNYNKIDIHRPDCLSRDTLPLFNPIITCSMTNTQDSPGDLSVRWVNYKDDMKRIPELEQVLDICNSSKDTHIFLTEHYKYDIALENLVSIVKLWSRLSYTNLQDIDIYPDVETTHSLFGSYSTSLLSVKFCEVSFTDFINYWKKFMKFREFILSNVDSYYRYNLQLFLDTFIFKYEDVSNHISIVKALQIEAIEIFKKLLNYCKKDAAYIISTIKGIDGSEDDTCHLLERKHIMDYLKFNDMSI
jgi:hypothetical protein